VGVFDPATNEFHLVGSTIPGNNKYWGGVLAPNGKIVFVPVDAHAVGVFDPTTNDFLAFDSSAGYVIPNYSGGVLAPNGMIFFVPFLAHSVGVFDPAANEFNAVTISSSNSTAGKYLGGVLTPSGRIVLVPYGAESVGIIDSLDCAPAYEVSGGALPESWRALLSQHANNF
jgi:streptogramin lyase